MLSKEKRHREVPDGPIGALPQRVQQRVWVSLVSVSARMQSTFAVLRVCRRAPLPDTPG